MSLAVYPSKIFGLQLNSTKTMEWNTIIQQSPGESELRIAQTQNPIWRWQLLYEQLFNDLTNTNYPNASELATLQGFYAQQQGKFAQFLFDDPEDDSVTNQALQLVNDGALSPTYYTPLQRNLGGQFLEDVTDLNGAEAIKANGVAQTGGGTNYTLLGPGLAIPGYSFMGMYLRWTAPPTPPITGSFNFCFRVRFDSDQQDFDRFLYQLWTIGGAEAGRGSGVVKLVSARPPGV